MTQTITRQEVMKQDRFYFDWNNNEASWMYHNTDAASGNQYVVNIFDEKLLDQALSERSDIKDVFCDIISDRCEQNLFDPDGDENFFAAKEKFESEPVAIGLNAETIKTLKLAFTARNLLELFCEKEFEYWADFTPNDGMGIAYTVLNEGTPDEKTVEAVADLNNYCIRRYVDDEWIETRQSDSLEAFVEEQLRCLDFSDLVSI